MADRPATTPFCQNTDILYALKFLCLEFKLEWKDEIDMGLDVVQFTIFIIFRIAVVSETVRTTNALLI